MGILACSRTLRRSELYEAYVDFYLFTLGLDDENILGSTGSTRSEPDLRTHALGSLKLDTIYS